MANQSCKDGKSKALCHNPKLCATTKSKLSKNSAQPNNAFVSLQGKTLFIWQIKVAKTAKAKLCLCREKRCLFGKSKLQRRQKQSSVHNQKQTIQEFGTAEFLCFCVFAGKNAVYLANQSCKDGKSKALCHNQSSVAQTQALWHKPKLCATTKALCHKPKLCATNQSSVPHKNRHNYPKNSAQPNNAFVSLQGKTLFIWQIKVAKTAKAKPKSKLSKNSAQPNNALCICREKRYLFGKSKLQRRQKQSSVPQPKLCATKHGIGGPGVLWHIKIRYLPNAVSQSLRIQLALNSLIRTPVSLAEKHSKAKTGKLTQKAQLFAVLALGSCIN